jgi:hypothetical protein
MLCGMGHNFVVAHCRKVQTTTGLRNVAAHNCREAVYDRELRPLEKLPDYISHPERAALNEGDRCGGLAVLKRRTDRILTADLARKPQKNAAAAIEIVISTSPEWMDSHKPHEWKAYFKDARAFLEERYGKENLVHWAVHYDEKTPHLHAIVVPIMAAELGKGLKYSSSAFLGGRKGLQELQAKIAQDVGRKYGLERGMEGSRARHTDQFEWASENAQERDNLAMERGSVDMRAKDLDAREAAISQGEAALAKRIATFEKLAEVELPSFEVQLAKKSKLSAIMTYTASDGTEGLSWAEYKAHETALQATEYAKTVLQAAKSKQLQASKYEADALKLPVALERLRQMKMAWDKDVATIRALSPKQLRDMAEKKEIELAQHKSRGPERAS